MWAFFGTQCIIFSQEHATVTIVQCRLPAKQQASDQLTENMTASRSHYVELTVQYASSPAASKPWIEQLPPTMASGDCMLPSRPITTAFAPSDIYPTQKRFHIISTCLTSLVASGWQNQVQTLLADASDSHRSSTVVPGRHCSVSNYQQSQTSEIVRNNGLRQTNDENEVRWTRLQTFRASSMELTSISSSDYNWY